MPSLSLTYDRQVDTEHYPILSAHQISGSPVVPFALMTEWMGHGALLENPGLKVHGLDEIRLLKGIRLKKSAKQLCFLTARLNKTATSLRSRLKFTMVCKMAGR